MRQHACIVRVNVKSKENGMVFIIMACVWASVFVRGRGEIQETENWV